MASAGSTATRFLTSMESSRIKSSPGGAIEYPVLTGLFMWLGGLLVDDSNSYLRVTAMLLVPFGMVTAYLLGRMTGQRSDVGGGSGPRSLFIP